MEQLPLQDWQVYYEGGNELCLAMHSNNGFLHWTKVELKNPLENFTRDNLLKSVVVNAVDGTLIA